MTNTITFPNTTESFKSALKKGIESYMESPVKKEGKLNESMAISLGFKNKDAMPKIEDTVKTTFVYIDDENEVTISDETIHPYVVANAQNGHRLEEREYLIDSILDIISEHERGSVNRTYMAEALAFLYSIKDEYVFSNIWDSQYVAASLNPVRFNELCDEMLSESQNLKTSNVVETSECWKCVDCGSEWSFAMGDDEVPEICPHCEND